MKDIELLENNGHFNAADILHKKFIKESQSLTPARNSDPYRKKFEQYFLAAKTKPSKNLINTIKNDGFLLNQDKEQLISYVNEMLANSTHSTTQNSPNAQDQSFTQTNQTSQTSTTTSPANGQSQPSSQNAGQANSNIPKLQERIDYYTKKIEEYNTTQDVKKKDKMRIWLSLYIDKNYNEGLLDSQSYNSLMSLLGEKGLS